MRIQLDLDGPGVDLVEALKERTGSKTHKELFNNALTLLQWAVRQRSEGRIVASMDESNENYRELQMPALEYVRQLRKRRSGSSAGTVELERS